MKKLNLKEFTNGWVVGNFDPSIIKTPDFEFLVRHYRKGDVDEKHVHKIAHEITVIVSGIFMLNTELIQKNDIMHLLPGEMSRFECIEDGSIAVIKTPSVVGDKYLL